MHSEFVICALAHPGGVRNSWGFHRNPFCERIRFLGLGRRLYHTGRDAMSADSGEESSLSTRRTLPRRTSNDHVRAEQRRVKPDIGRVRPRPMSTPQPGISSRVAYST